MVYHQVYMSVVLLLVHQTDYPAKEYQVGQDDVMIGKIGGIPFYISETQHTAWKNTDLVIDCVEGMGGMFSLDNGTGRRFLTRSEICIPEDTTIN